MRTINLFVVLLLSVSCASTTDVTPPSVSDTANPEQQATNAATAWLQLLDSEQYANSWSAAAPLFKSAVTADQWAAAASSARRPFGKIVSRRVRSAVFTTSLPGAPTGEYVVITYDSAFEKIATAVETVTPARDARGHWKVSGYFVK